MKWFAIIFIAIMVEGVTEYLKLAVPALAAKPWAVVLFTVLLGMGAALAFGADIFEIVGLSAKIPYVGQALTGILVGRGSNYIYDLVGKITDAAVVSSRLEHDPLGEDGDEVEHEVVE